MKRLVWVVGLLLVACTAYKSDPYSFEEGWFYLKQLDTKYGTDIKKERMDLNFLDVRLVDGFQQDLAAFRQRVSQDPDSLDKQKLLTLIEVRKRMLESERLYQLALGMGDFKSNESRTCARMKEMEYAFKYYKAAMEKGSNASWILDGVLQDFEPAQRLVGVNDLSRPDAPDERPRFYLSHWDETSQLLEELAEALNSCAGV